MISGDTIVAQATPFGYSGTALIRISGPSSIKILSKLTGVKTFKPRLSTYSKIRSNDNAIIDYALEANRYYNVLRSSGTLLAYKDQRTSENLLDTNPYSYSLVSEV